MKKYHIFLYFHKKIVANTIEFGILSSLITVEKKKINSWSKLFSFTKFFFTNDLFSLKH